MSIGIILELIALLLVATSVFGLLNHHLFKLPHTIGLVVSSLCASGVILLVHSLIPEWGLAEGARGILSQIDFSKTLLLGLLSFLLFAGALHVNLSTLAALPERVETEIIGESLFNDGVAIVIFTIVLSIATGTVESVGGDDIAIMFVTEALGGITLGLVTGYLAFLALRSVDDHVVEILITLSLVTATYGIATRLHVSGPLAVVAAGLLIGNPGARFGMSKKTRDHLFAFWEMTDEILNSILFVLIGFEVLALTAHLSYIWLILALLPLVLLARLISVGVPLFAFGMMQGRKKGSLTILTWGGLHGAISVALVLSLPAGPIRDMLLAASYAIVLFSIVVQGLTLEWVARRFGPKP